jgi:CelD/BcsL family acetyltransferase involved in cellulose biosynthesis
MKVTRWLDAWPPLPPGAVARRPRAELPFPLGDPGTRLYAVARHGLWHGLRALGLVPGDAVLVPAWHHGSEVEAMVRLGLEVRFWGGTERAEPDERELEGLLDERARALHLIHYLGFPQDAARWRAFCDTHDLALVEDAAQSWLAADADGTQVGTHGDIAIWSLYKTFGLPDGAALRAPGLAGLAPAEGGARRGALEAGELALRWVAQRAPAHPRRVSRPYDPSRDFQLGDPQSVPAQASSLLLARVADAGAAGRRRANYRVLLDALGDRVPPPFERLPHGASPWVFPIEVTDKPAVRDRLAAAGIGALDVWSVPHPALDAAAFEAIAARRAHTLGLPIHQELSARDLERIAAVASGRGRPAPAVRVESLEDLREEWGPLAERAGNPFGTWEWAHTWCDHFSPAEVVIGACRRGDGTLAALLPLVVAREQGVRVARWLGHGPADELGPVCAPADRPLAAAGLRALARQGAFDLLHAEALPGEAAWESRVDGVVVERDASPLIDLAGFRDWEAWLASRSSNFRSQVRSRERKLGRDAELTFVASHDPADLDTVIALHDARWEGVSEAFAAPRAEFHRAFARTAAERGWLRLWRLELDGRTAAAWYGLRFAGEEWYYQSGRDPSAPGSVGFVLLARTIRAALEDGCSAYRLGLGDESYKERFADRDPGLVTLAVPGTTRGRAALAAWRAKRALATHRATNVEQHPL